MATAPPEMLVAVSLADAAHRGDRRPDRCEPAVRVMPPLLAGVSQVLRGTLAA